MTNPLPPHLTVCPRPDEVALRAAELFAELAGDAVRQRGRFTVALSGGSTPAALYGVLASEPLRSAVAWSSVWAFFGDERFVPHDDPRSNYALAQQRLLRHVPLPPAQVVPIPTALPTAADAAESYAATLARLLDRSPDGGWPVFDLILLGLGEDGHTASLFPHRAALGERRRAVIASPPGRLPPPVERVSLTFPVINAARRVVFLATGPSKSAVLEQVLGGQADPADFPAAAVRPASPPHWIVDREAASRLSAGRRP